jgi:LytTR family transcriptional regulator, CO-responsive transcriptional regulator RcoM
MQNLKSSLSIGLVLLSPDFRVIGMNDYARRLLAPAMGEGLGKNLLEYHPRKTQEKIKGLLMELSEAEADTPFAMVIDVLNKVLMINLSRLEIVSPVPQLHWAMTFIDVSEQTGAAINTNSGRVELKKFPVYEDGLCRFLEADTVYCIRSDGNYCKVFTVDRSYYLHLSLKVILQRYTGPDFFRVHKSYIVNLRHVKEMSRSSDGQTMITFDREAFPPVPIARRKLAEFKQALAHR